MTEVQSYAAMSEGGAWSRHTITRRPVGDDDVAIDIKFAGICHSDIHQVRQEWGPAMFPMVPGHEIGGVVTAVGKNVTEFKVGDHAGVGCLVDSCRDCKKCKLNEQQYCSEGGVFTYNAKYKYKVEPGNITYGGYSKAIVVDKAFTCTIPTSLDLAAATPLLCAGITVYSPMKKFGLTPDMKGAIIGLGGLGHCGVKIMKAMGCHTTVISRGLAKKEDAMEALKANAYLDSTDEAAMTAAAGSIDFIICTVAANFDLQVYLNLLAIDGKIILVGAGSSNLMAFNSFGVLFKRQTIAGSLIGGVAETQEMLNFCGEHGIVCDIETIKADDIAVAYDRVVKSDVKYRFVIDCSTI